MYLPLAGNDTVSISMWRDGGVRFKKCRLLTEPTNDQSYNHVL